VVALWCACHTSGMKEESNTYSSRVVRDTEVSTICAWLQHSALPPPMLAMHKSEPMEAPPLHAPFLPLRPLHPAGGTEAAYAADSAGDYSGKGCNAVQAVHTLHNTPWMISPTGPVSCPAPATDMPLRSKYLQQPIPTESALVTHAPTQLHTASGLACITAALNPGTAALQQ
jgi:hypothetical protein